MVEKERISNSKASINEAFTFFRNEVLVGSTEPLILLPSNWHIKQWRTLDNENPLKYRLRRTVISSPKTVNNSLRDEKYVVTLFGLTSMKEMMHARMRAVIRLSKFEKELLIVQASKPMGFVQVYFTYRSEKNKGILWNTMSVMKHVGDDSTDPVSFNSLSNSLQENLLDALAGPFSQEYIDSINY